MTSLPLWTRFWLLLAVSVVLLSLVSCATLDEHP
jgi:hypothetical protein